MAGTILENLSGKKLSILVGTLLICQLVCFLIGGLVGMLMMNEQTSFLESLNHFFLIAMKLDYFE